MTLQEFFVAHPKVALGFSGGVDSSYLLYAAKQAGADVRPYFAKTQFQPEFELEDAKRLAELVDIELTILPYDVLPTAGFNPPDRCYYCKTALFGALVAQAKADGYDTIIDGTNASDDAGERPGMKALQEMQVLSPLRLCGLGGSGGGKATAHRRLARDRPADHAKGLARGSGLGSLQRIGTRCHLRRSQGCRGRCGRHRGNADSGGGAVSQ